MKQHTRLAVFGAVLTLAMQATLSNAQQGKSRGYVVDFSASWCGPCQQMAPMVERLARQGYPILSIDVDERPDLKRKYRITNLPTFVLFVDGKEQKRQVGAMPESEVKRMLAAIPKSPARSAPPVRLADQGSNPPRQQPSAMEKTRSALLDLIPGRNRQSPVAAAGPTVVRGNANDARSRLPIARGPMASSVRIRVRIGENLNYGSGTVINSSPGRATIATCWHIFRGASREAKIEVDTFFTGTTETYVAKVVALDEAADVGLIEVSTDSEWPVVKIASVDHAPRVDESVISIGCGGGQDPTRQSIRVTRLDPYNGPSNTECSGVPIRGRSGGGLFNARDELIGVCSAADKQDKRGIYAGLAAVHDVLDRSQLAHLYRGTAGVEGLASGAPGSSRPSGFPDDPIAVPASDNRFEMTSGDQPSVDEFLGSAGGSSGATAPRWPAESSPAVPTASGPGLLDVGSDRSGTANPFAGLDSARGTTPIGNPPASSVAASNPGSGDDVEIVCVIRSKSRPELGSRVIVIDQSDPRLLELLREYDRRAQAK